MPSSSPFALPHQVLWDMAPDGLILIGPDGRVAMANRSAEAIFGCQEGELVGRVTHDLLPQSRRESSMRSREGFLSSLLPNQGPPTVEIDVVAGDGTIVPIELTLRIVPQDSQRFVVASLRDVRVRKQTEALLERHTDLFSRLPIAVLIGHYTDRNDPESLRLVAWNSASEAFTQRNLEGCRNESFRRVFAASVTDEMLAAFHQAFVSGGTHDFGVTEGQEPATIGRYFRIMLTSLPGDFAAILVEDVTQRHQAEELLAERTREVEHLNQELEAFSYSVSHDLRAPLRSLDGFSQALVEDAGDTIDENCRGHLKRIRANAQRMGELIDDLIRLSRVSRAELEMAQVNLTELCRQVAQPLLTQKEPGSVELRIEDGLQGRGDARLLRVVFDNLLSNALKFTRDRRPAVIEFGRLPREPGGDSSPTFFVKDNGVGFDEAYTAKLFVPFQRLHSAHEFPGTGIGLATVQRVIHRHGGVVRAQGAVGQGTTIYFSIAH
jgi:PAS domain S-box-containing protein